MQNISGVCFHYQIKKCKGICRGKEEIQQYNERVNKALKTLLNKETYIIKETGRTTDEESVILVKNGVYCGFGFFSKLGSKFSLDTYEDLIDSKQDNSDIQRILRSYQNKNEKENRISYEEEIGSEF